MSDFKFEIDSNCSVDPDICDCCLSPFGHPLHDGYSPDCKVHSVLDSDWLHPSGIGSDSETYRLVDNERACCDIPYILDRCGGNRDFSLVSCDIPTDHSIGSHLSQLDWDSIRKQAFDFGAWPCTDCGIKAYELWVIVTIDPLMIPCLSGRKIHSARSRTKVFPDPHHRLQRQETFLREDSPRPRVSIVSPKTIGLKPTLTTTSLLSEINLPKVLSAEEKLLPAPVRPISKDLYDGVPLSGLMPLSDFYDALPLMDLRMSRGSETLMPPSSTVKRTETLSSSGPPETPKVSETIWKQPLPPSLSIETSIPSRENIPFSMLNIREDLQLY